jgi:dipeptidyl aminopeptidase/acylaminoacyl peptidase
MFVLSVSLLLSTFVFSTFTLVAQQVESSKLLDINDLDKWETIFGGATLSEDGNWVIYPVRKNDRTTESRLHNLVNGKVKNFAESSPFRFSKDNKWLGFIVSPDAKTREKLTADKKPILRKFGLLNLATDETIYINEADTFNFSGDSKFVAIKKSPATPEAKTFNIIVRDLTSGKDRVFGNIKEFAWSEKGSLLAFTADLADKVGNSVTLFDGRTQSVQVLDSQASVYSALNWRRESEDLAVVRSFEDKNYKDPNNEILVWRDLAKSVGNSSSFKSSSFANFPKDWRITDKPAFQWSLDGKSLFFNIEEWKLAEKKDEKKDEKKEEAKKPEPAKESPEIPALEIWNASDVLTIPEQKLRTENKSFLSVWHTESNKFVQLGEENLTLRPQNNSPIITATSDKPYEFEGMFGRPSYDVYSVDTTTGAKKKILTDIAVLLNNSVSPGGRYYVYLQNDHLNLFDFSTGKSQNLTKELNDSFVREDDHPVRQRQAEGFISWDEKGTYFLAHSRSDVWKFDAANGKATRITKGKESGLEYRFENANSRKPLDLTQPFYLRRFDPITKKMGYSLSKNGTATDFFWGDGIASSPNKAENADVFAFTIESYNDSPDVFVMQPGSVTPKQVSNINPFEKEFKSGKAEVIQYTNAKGQKLQGSLYYPDDYVPGKKYPMITYIYEMLSDGFHRNTTPSNTNYYNRRIFTSQGYFYFMPDIVFDAGDPGVSSVKTLEIAVKTVVDKGLVDEKRVGLMGHSWGGYQAAYAVTGTNIFAASVAGAGISNLVTMYGTLTPSFGNQFESKHFEVGQERMIVPPWKNMEGYLRNSAIANIQKMQTPLLMETGDADKNVNWGQAHEMYNAARREKKPMVLLVYANEGHGLTTPKNQKDYQKRILEWFAHYLKNEPAKKWIKDNIPYQEQQKLLKDRELE